MEVIVDKDTITSIRMVNLNDAVTTMYPLLQPPVGCLLYTSDAADDLIGVDAGCRRLIKNKKQV